MIKKNNRKKYFLLPLFAFIFLSASSQKEIKGLVKDAKTGESLRYVNIGIPGGAKGTVSGHKGSFSLQIPSDEYAGDSLRFSMIGYESLMLPVDSLLGKNNKKPKLIKLNPMAYPLNQFEVVEKEEWKTKILGNNIETRAVSGTMFSGKLGAEIGTVIRIKEKPTIIEEFRFYVVHNDLDSLFFRLNIYNLKDGKPHKKILYENIYITHPDISDQRVTVDLRPYNIKVNGDFFIALEYLKPFVKDDGTMTFDMGVNGPFRTPSYTRATSQAGWEKIPGFTLGFNVKAKY